ncbi:LysR family transcriptional regulator [Vreelandella titanicae]|uniref:LysR family transcriptional regulator n=1 Tax=Vreelandella titanicae TaxID=664683 RepID=UPI003FD6E233
MLSMGWLMKDLNLIRVFVTIYETGSVSKAAENLHISQPSVSYSLSRLRQVFNDPLFNRTREGMQPTSLSSQLYLSLSHSLSEIEKAISLTKKFDPLTSKRCFKLALTDLGEVFFLPSILESLKYRAPSVELEVIPIDAYSLSEWISKERIDAAVCNQSYLLKKFTYKNIFPERYVCMLSECHPRIGDILSMGQYLEERHVVVSDGTGHHLVEDYLFEAGITRNVMLKVPHFSVLPDVISSSDLLVTLPSRVAQLYAKRMPLKFFELPFGIPGFEVGIHYKEHRGDSSAQSWFCDFLIKTLNEM